MQRLYVVVDRTIGPLVASLPVGFVWYWFPDLGFPVACIAVWAFSVGFVDGKQECER